jgi:UDP-N-acetylglucosamine transferase subunit ALG13
LIFATVGTCFKSFDRFLKGVDLFASKSATEVYMQTGYGCYTPKYCNFERFIDINRMNALIKEAEIVICHAGYGIIGDCVRHNKKTVIIPREPHNDEAVDLQFELGKHVSIIYPSMYCIRDTALLEETINQLINEDAPTREITCTIPDIVYDFINNEDSDRP